MASNYSMGGIIRFVDEKNDNKKVEKRKDGSLSKFNKVDEIPSNLEDDGKPLMNEFLEELKLKAEKQKIKEKKVLEIHKEETYKTFVKDLLEASDDIFDSKGDDITEKDFLKNEMELKWIFLNFTSNLFIWTKLF